MPDAALVEPSAPLSPRQLQVFDWMVRYTIDRFYQPSMREVMDAVGVRSPNAILVHLKAIERKGLIRLFGQKSRAIEFLRRVPIGGPLA